MKKILFLALLLLPLPASGQITFTFPPCDPVLLVGPEGRPIPNSTVQVTNPDGSLPANGVWSNYTGTVPFDNRIPADQILQVYADTGIYRVQVSGAGITKSYYIRCSTGTGGAKISIDRTPDLLLLNTTSPPTLVCPLGQHCTLSFDQDNVALFDFLLPSFDVTLFSILLTFQTAESQVNIEWDLNYCVYNTGQAMCSPIGMPNNKVFLHPVGLGIDFRQDLLIDGHDFPTAAWAPDSHVVFSITRGHTVDTGSLPAFLQNIRLEFTR